MVSVSCLGGGGGGWGEVYFLVKGLWGCAAGWGLHFCNWIIIIGILGVRKLWQVGFFLLKNGKMCV